MPSTGSTVEGMELSGGEQRALRALGTAPTRTWVAFTGRPGAFYYYQGVAPDRTWRLTQLHHAPYGKTVHHVDSDTGAVHDRRAPRGINAGPVVVVLMGLLVVPLSMNVTRSMGVLYPAVPILAAAAFLVWACVAQYTPMYPDDAFTLAQAARQRAQPAQSTQEELLRLQRQQLDAQAAAARRTAQWQEATWAQQKALNPNEQWAPGDHFPPPSSR